MASETFPTSPTNGQQYLSTRNGHRYVYEAATNTWSILGNEFVEKSQIGTDPLQIPQNQHLDSAAYVPVETFATAAQGGKADTAIQSGDNVSVLVNDANYATESYVGTAVSNLVDSAPGTLDTLNELAAALGDDPNFATTVSNQIGTKADKTITITAGTGLTGGGDLTINRTISHADTSSQATVANTARTYIQSITLDGFGHITAIGSATETVTNTWGDIHDSPVDGATTISISSNWAFDNVKTPVPAGALFTDTVYTHPTHPGDDIDVDTGALTGAVVISDLDINVTTDALGHVTDANAVVATRSLTASDVGASASGHNHTLDGLSNVNITTIATGEILKWSGTEWVNNTPAEAGIATEAYVNSAIESVSDASLALGGKADKTTTITAGTGLTGGGDLSTNRTISHADTSSQATVTNTGTTFIQSLTLDGFGHITAISSGSVSVSNTWRDIHDSPVDGATEVSISSNWAFDNVKTPVPAGALFTDTVYTHPSYAGDSINVDTGALTGATVISDLDFNVTTDASGHVTDANAVIATRNLTASDVGAASSSHNHTLDGLSNVNITTISAGEIVKWSGTAWVNNTLAEAGIQPAGSYAAATHDHDGDYLGISSNAVSATKLFTARNINGVSFDGTGNIVVEPYISDNDTGDTNCPIIFSANTTAGYKRLYEDSALYFDNTNNRLYSTWFYGSLSGNASSATNCSRSVVAGTGLTGGGALTANRTINVTYGTAAGTACEGNDARLSDARTPTSHTHTSAEISDATSANTANMIVKRDGSGDFTAGTISATDFNSTSDRAKKENIRTITDAMTKVNLLTGVEFTFKESKKDSIGLIAQDVEQIIPQVVSGEEGNKSVSYGSIVGLLVEAMKEQETRIKELEDKIIQLTT